MLKLEKIPERPPGRSEGELGALLKDAPGVIVVLDSVGEIVFANRANWITRSIVEQPEKQTILEACRRAIRSGRGEVFEFGMFEPSQPEFWYQCDVKPVFESVSESVGESGAGKPSAVIAVCADITARKKKEERLRRSESLLVDAQGVAHLGTWEWALGQSDVVWSSELYRIYGEAPEKFKPTFQGFLAKVHPDDRERVQGVMMRVFSEHISFSHDERIVRPNGEVRHLHTWGHPLLDESGNAVRLIGVCQDITRRKLAEAELKTSLSLLKATLEATADGIVSIDQNEHITGFNQTFLDLWNLSRDQVENRGYQWTLNYVLDHLVHPEICLRRLHEILSMPEQESHDVLEFKNGRVFERYSRPQRLGEKIMGRVFSYRDITERVRSERAHQRYLSLLRATLESTADGILMVDCEGKIASYNQKFLQLWGIPKEIVDSKDDSKAIAFVVSQLAKPEGFVKKVRELYANPEQESYDVLEFKDGKIFERYSRPQKIEDKIVGRVWSFRDVTARVRAERALKSLADVSRNLAEARFDLKAVTQALVLTASEFFEDGCVIQLFSEDRSRSRIEAFHHVQAAVFEQMRRVLPLSRSFREEKAVQDLLKEQFPIRDWIVVPLRVGGRSIGSVSVFRIREGTMYSSDDHAFLQELGDRAALSIDNAGLFLDSQKAIQLREDFMSIASHELKTPLTPLKLQLQLLSHFIRTEAIVSGSKAERLRKLIDESDQQVIRLIRLVEDMLDVSRLRTGHLTLVREKVDLGMLVMDVVERFRAQLFSAKCPIQFHGEPEVAGDWDRLRTEQVVINLLSNATKYGAGKPIQIDVKVDATYAVLSVRDAGIGIPKEEQTRIFGRFERAVSARRFGGLGMGLYITRQIVEAHGGYILVESEPGKGACFTVGLPLGKKT